MQANFFTPYQKEPPKTNKILLIIICVFTFVFGALVILTALSFLETQLINGQAQEYENKMKDPKFAAQLAKVDQIAQEYEEVQKTEKGVAFMNKVALGAHIGNGMFFDALMDARTETVQYTKITMDGSGIFIEGVAEDQGRVAEYEEGLRDTQDYDIIFIETYQRQKNGKNEEDEDIYSYTFKANLNLSNKGYEKSPLYERVQSQNESVAQGAEVDKDDN